MGAGDFPLSYRAFPSGAIYLSYAELGPPEAQPLVLVHGYTGSSEDFKPLIKVLAKTYRVIVYDQRGHGRSNHCAASKYTLSNLVGDLSALVQYLQLDNFKLLGHSMGGMVALNYCLQALDKVQLLVLMSTGADSLQLPVESSKARFRRKLNQNRAFSWVEPLKARLGRDTAAHMTRELRTTDELKRLFEQTGRENHRRVDPEARLMLGQMMAQLPNQESRLHLLPPGSKIIVGEYDATFAERSKRMHMLAPQTQLELLPGVGHFPQFEAPRMVIEAVTSTSVSGFSLPPRPMTQSKSNS